MSCDAFANTPRSIVNTGALSVLTSIYFYFARQGCNVLWCVGYVCLSVCVSVSVCMSARITRKPHSRTATNFLCLLPVAMAQSCFDGVAIYYLLPVLRMTLCLEEVRQVAVPYLQLDFIRSYHWLTEFVRMRHRGGGGGKVCHLRFLCWHSCK